jgi:hypothetical protein
LNIAISPASTNSSQEIRKKSTRESHDVKEQLQRKEQIKEAAKKRQEKLEDLEVKKRIKARIEADRLERKRREEDAKAMREGKPLPAQAAAPVAPVVSASGSSAATARLRLQTKNGNLVKAYPSETTLFEVAQQIEEEVGAPITKFSMTFPRKVFEAGVDFGQTLAEAGLAPSAVLVVN